MIASRHGVNLPHSYYKRPSVHTNDGKEDALKVLLLPSPYRKEQCLLLVIGLRRASQLEPARISAVSS